MPATAAATLAVRADPIEVFTARAEARAYLWAEHQISLHQAVDKLQFDAVRDGLVAAIGQDRVQAEMAKAFRAVRQPYIVENVARVPNPIPEPEPELEPGPRAAESTVDALVYSLRQRGEAALAERNTQRRLGELSTGQVRKVIARLMDLRLCLDPAYPAITDELLFQLGEQLA